MNQTVMIANSMYMQCILYHFIIYTRFSDSLRILFLLYRIIFSIQMNSEFVHILIIECKKLLGTKISAVWCVIPINI